MKAFRMLAAAAAFFGVSQAAPAADLPTIRLGWVVPRLEVSLVHQAAARVR